MTLEIQCLEVGPWPMNCYLVRCPITGEEVLIAHHDTVIQAEDHIILFLQDKSRVPEVEKMFQVAPTFL